MSTDLSAITAAANAELRRMGVPFPEYATNTEKLEAIRRVVADMGTARLAADVTGCGIDPEMVAALPVGRPW